MSRKAEPEKSQPQPQPEPGPGPVHESYRILPAAPGETNLSDGIMIGQTCDFPTTFNVVNMNDMIATGTIVEVIHP